MRNTGRNWQEIIANLNQFAESGKDVPPLPYAAFAQTAQLLQALEDNHGTEAEKEAFFASVEDVYHRFAHTKQQFEAAMAQDKQAAQEREEQQARRAEKWAKWEALPFYAKDRFSDVMCVESKTCLEDKICAFEGVLDNLKAIPHLLEAGAMDTCQTQAELMIRLAEMSKLYILFAGEQFATLAAEMQGGAQC